MIKESHGGYASVLRVAFASLLTASLACQSPASAFGIVTHVPMHGPHIHTVTLHAHAKSRTNSGKTSTTGKQARTANSRSAHGKTKKQKAVAHKEPPAPPPQDLVGKLSSKTIADGVVYKFYRGPLNINVIDVNMTKSAVRVRPVLAGNTFCHLADVKNHARQCQAIAAVNANYFKKDGTPLGTLMIDKEWVAGPIFDRVSLGITKCGYVRIDRVNLYGILKTSSPSAPSIWVNNINQPRRHGCHLVLYTRRWGDAVRMPYAGCLVSINAAGKVVDKKTTAIAIPAGGFVLSDTGNGQISHLHVGDLVNLSWHAKPANWEDVEQAVSGGPMLIKDGELYVDLQAENFRKAWTGRQIHARTAAGVTAYNHLLLVTIEGSHTLWDFAKFLRKLGAVEAMNLDGGGSTTMVVNGVTVTRNAKSFERRVASSLAVIEGRIGPSTARNQAQYYVPNCDLTDFILPEMLHQEKDSISGLELPEPPPEEQAELKDKEPTAEPVSTETQTDNIVSQADTPSNVP